MIQRIDLSGEWEFCLDAGKQGVEQKFFQHGFNDVIKLPTTTAQARKGIKSNEKSVMYLTEYYHFEGYTWYRKCIELKELSQGQRCFLRMERTRISSVWLNDVFVGTQESLISAHWYDLTDAISACEDNNGQADMQNFVANGRGEKKKYYLTVMVSNVDYKAPGGHMTSPDTQTNWNGILGDISLYLYQTVRIADAQICASAENRRIDMKLAVSNFGDAGEGEITVECSACHRGRNTADMPIGYADNGEDSLLTREIRKVQLQKGDNEIELSFDIPKEKEIALWNEFTPSLYQVNICVNADDCMLKGTLCMENRALTESVSAGRRMQKEDTCAAESSDSVIVTIGFRDLHTSKDSFYLNELPIFLRGKQEGLAFPITGYAPMDTDAWRQRFKIAKDYGLNHYRFHTCCPPEAAFEAADEIGIYLEPEIHFWGTIAEPGEPEYDKARQDYLIEEGYRILKEFGNHPSFLMFSLGNELWGSAKELGRILRLYKAVDKRHWYTQGSNNFQFTPVILEEDDFFCGVRFSKERLFRGSYAMCDAPQGHVQLLEPENTYSYDNIFQADVGGADKAKAEKAESGEVKAEEYKADEGAAAELEDGTVEIQYQTGTKKVKAADANEQLEAHIPVVSHEIGQYETYPDFREIERYTGVLGAENFKIFKKRLEDAGMLHKAYDFFKSSGALAVACYKRELETAFRSSRLAGFQLLDLQDFPGQGTSLVGILNAFMESKGLIEAGEWRQFCSERVLMLQFPQYVYQAGENFDYQVLFYNGNPCIIENAKLQITLEECNADANVQNKVAKQVASVGNLTATRLSCLYEGQILLPNKDRPKKYKITVEICDTQIKNSYEIYVYPDIQKRSSDKVVVTSDKAEMLFNLKQGKKVLYLGGKMHDDCSMEGTYCANFWNYPMFASISENMGKEKPIGTMGLCIESTHSAFNLFPTESYTTPQWWKIVTGTQLAVLDNTEVEPIVWMIDNFDRNHKIGLIYEAKVGDGSLLVCQKDLLCAAALEEKWLYESLISYAESEQFAPEKRLTEEQLDRLYA